MQHSRLPLHEGLTYSIHFFELQAVQICITRYAICQQRYTTGTESLRKPSGCSIDSESESSMGNQAASFRIGTSLSN